MFGRMLALRLKLPGVLGELLIGVILGNLFYSLGSELMIVLREGPTIYDISRCLLQGLSLQESIASAHLPPSVAHSLDHALSSPAGVNYFKIAYVLDIFSRYGVLFLLFLVGVESSLQELKQTGYEALKVASLGVIMPMLLGLWVTYVMLPNLSWSADLFIGATLCATSVGVTARVLQELKQLHTREARTILGAAMVDDILGLFILAVVSGIVVEGHIEIKPMISILMSTVFFFVAVLTLGPWVLKRLIRIFSSFEHRDTKLMVSFIFLMIIAWFATTVHLAAIVGAFMAGLLIHDEWFVRKESRADHSIHDLVSPIEKILAPLFFTLIGFQVKLEILWHPQVLILALLLTVVAVLGKLISGLGAHRTDRRWLVGCGMIPRGEVGLVFASIGKTLGVMNDEIFSAMIVMVMLTTLMTPIALKWLIEKK
jgi:Kef-type K+ transport system membrane component KefB